MEILETRNSNVNRFLSKTAGLWKLLTAEVKGLDLCTAPQYIQRLSSRPCRVMQEPRQGL